MQYHKHDNTYKMGIDIGSTTVKVVLTDAKNKIAFARYRRHFSEIKKTVKDILKEAKEEIGNAIFSAMITGSGGVALAKAIGVEFIQEVVATANAIEASAPQTDVAIELGGEDAKIIYFEGGNVEQRMNGVCAGGTGSFIDQMASLLQTDATGLNELAKKYEVIYPIASRCGVFAKTDIQPLINEGAKKEDLAASIFQAVVNQTIAGLACGKPIRGHVAFLGGPLHFLSELRGRFIETLKLTDETTIIPENSHLFAAYGTAVSNKGEAELDFNSLLERLENGVELTAEVTRMDPLFKDEEDYETFKDRHDRDKVKRIPLSNYHGDAFLGIDAGSTTTKVALVSDKGDLLYSFYAGNEGSPLNVVMKSLNEMYDMMPADVVIRNSCVTGYGEGLIKEALMIDLGYIETVAHYKAAQFFKPDVDFILDIGGQDIKCFKIKNGAIDSILLNEACSSGCGSFIETFARSMGYHIAEFAQHGLRSTAPVNLGSRCTVFMNSAVKQSQKEGATVEDISAGLSVSVVKNAIYKVIRANSPDELGKHIVVQGGTFYNDAVLRAFELELGAEVIRPAIAGLMGAYGAALYAMKFQESTLIRPEALQSFTHTSRSTVCNGCNNHCHLTVNTFPGGKRFISGNQCQKGAGLMHSDEELPNLYAWKREQFLAMRPQGGKRGKLGLPLALGMYELAPLWYGLFTELGFNVILSGLSTRRTYEKGQFSIPSDTACYPAKIMHGHMEQLLDVGVDAVFYPSLSYNIDEKAADNHYNCPVVAYYAELLHGNMDRLKETKFLYPYLNINDRKQLVRTLLPAVRELEPTIMAGEVKKAVEVGFRAYEQHMQAVRRQGELALEYARSHGKRIMVLAGRPYHVDPEISHGIDKLAASLGFVVVSEDSVCHLAQRPSVRVLNQWTYHARLYRAAQFAAENPDVELVQLVSFGCGVDAITTDEVRTILERAGKFYTQIKIDEITNLGAVKIRLRSLLGALENAKCGMQNSK